jgi:hypothetical protein
VKRDYCLAIAKNVFAPVCDIESSGFVKHDEILNEEDTEMSKCSRNYLQDQDGLSPIHRRESWRRRLFQ